MGKNVRFESGAKRKMRWEILSVKNGEVKKSNVKISTKKKRKIITKENSKKYYNFNKFSIKNGKFQPEKCVKNLKNKNKISTKKQENFNEKNSIK